MFKGNSFCVWEELVLFAAFFASFLETGRDVALLAETTPLSQPNGKAITKTINSGNRRVRSQTCLRVEKILQCSSDLRRKLKLSHCNLALSDHLGQVFAVIRNHAMIITERKTVLAVITQSS